MVNKNDRPYFCNTCPMRGTYGLEVLPEDLWVDYDTLHDLSLIHI